MKILKITLITLVTIVILIMAVVNIFPQVPIYLFFKLADKLGNKQVVTVEKLDLKNVKHLQSNKYFYNGLTLYLPKKALSARKEKMERSTERYFIQYDKDKSVGVLRLESQIKNTLSGILEKDKMFRKKDINKDALFIKNYIKNKNIDSDYEFTKYLFSINPDKISIFTPGDEAIAAYILYDFNSIYIPKNQHRYSFETQELKGFQLKIISGDQNNKRITSIIDVYSKKYNLKWQLIFANITQKEIEQILVSAKVSSK